MIIDILIHINIIILNYSVQTFTNLLRIDKNSFYVKLLQLLCYYNLLSTYLCLIDRTPCTLTCNNIITVIYGSTFVIECAKL